MFVFCAISVNSSSALLTPPPPLPPPLLGIKKEHLMAWCFKSSHGFKSLPFNDNLISKDNQFVINCIEGGHDKN